jgi:hypothetical protein
MQTEHHLHKFRNSVFISAASQYLSGIGVYHILHSPGREVPDFSAAPEPAFLLPLSGSGPFNLLLQLRPDRSSPIFLTRLRFLRFPDSQHIASLRISRDLNTDYLATGFAAHSRNQFFWRKPLNTRSMAGLVKFRGWTIL